jgi:hypothetical protein
LLPPITIQVSIFGDALGNSASVGQRSALTLLGGLARAEEIFIGLPEIAADLLSKGVRRDIGPVLPAQFDRFFE